MHAPPEANGQPTPSDTPGQPRIWRWAPLGLVLLLVGSATYWWARPLEQATPSPTSAPTPSPTPTPSPQRDAAAVSATPRVLAPGYPAALANQQRLIQQLRDLQVDQRLSLPPAPDQGEAPTPAAAAADRSEADARAIIITGHELGEIEPCG